MTKNVSVAEIQPLDLCPSWDLHVSMVSRGIFFGKCNLPGSATLLLLWS